MSLSPAASHGEMKRRIAELLGTDPSRYSEDLGNERHKELQLKEIDWICQELGVGFVDGSKQEKRDMIMIKLGRDHRTGVRGWDSSDLRAVIERLEAQP